MDYFKSLFSYLLIGANTASASTSEFIGVIGAAIGDIKIKIMKN